MEFLCDGGRRLWGPSRQGRDDEPRGYRRYPIGSKWSWRAAALFRLFHDVNTFFYFVVHEGPRLPAAITTMLPERAARPEPDPGHEIPLNWTKLSLNSVPQRKTWIQFLSTLYGQKCQTGFSCKLMKSHVMRFILGPIFGRAAHRPKSNSRRRASIVGRRSKSSACLPTFSPPGLLSPISPTLSSIIPNCHHREHGRGITATANSPNRP